MKFHIPKYSCFVGCLAFFFISCKEDNPAKSAGFSKDSSKIAISKDTIPPCDNGPCGNQDSIDAEYTHSQLADKYFIIITSTKSLDEAYNIARKAEKQTGIKFHDNKVKTDSLGGGLTFPSDTCLANGFSYPCYIPRGRYDDGIYFSIESSDYYDGFTKGFFMVVAGSNSTSDELKIALSKIKKYFPDSYLKNSKVYMGCIH